MTGVVQLQDQARRRRPAPRPLVRAPLSAADARPLGETAAHRSSARRRRPREGKPSRRRRPNRARAAAAGDVGRDAGKKADRRRLPAKDRLFVQNMVLHRDDDVIVLNKPPGLAVQGGTKTERHLDALLPALAQRRRRPPAPRPPSRPRHLGRDDRGAERARRRGVGEIVPRPRCAKNLLGADHRRADAAPRQDRRRLGQARRRRRTRTRAHRRGRRGRRRQDGRHACSIRSITSPRWPGSR